jgi:hypothetical protein
MGLLVPWLAFFWIILQRTPAVSLVFVSGGTVVAFIALMLAVVLYPVRSEPFRSKAIREYYVICLLVCVICLMLAVVPAPVLGEKPSAPLKLVAKVLSLGAFRPSVVTVAFVALLLAVFCWGLVFADQSQRLQAEAIPVPDAMNQARQKVLEFLTPIQGEAKEQPVASFISMRKRPQGSVEFTVAVSETVKAQDARGEWITTQREKRYTVTVDREGHIRGFDEAKKP